MILKSQFLGKFDVYNSDIVWSGHAWKCGKQLKHYPAFCRNDTTITISKCSSNFQLPLHCGISLTYTQFV
ncbi:hypothetical protein GIB67_021374 [Kingdonia uniflora]|uniref:Uncharacterized protein n=1 Tax=Kingdonia uniflora TaxID=39325 RepID=A0A7J7MD70_9MAGN|nr:hypothetical protein GIB67_021374 [Kingdonia uniflora]